MKTYLLLENTSRFYLDIHQHGGILDHHWTCDSLVCARDDSHFEILFFHILNAVCLVVLVSGLLHLQVLGQIDPAWGASSTHSRENCVESRPGHEG